MEVSLFNFIKKNNFLISKKEFQCFLLFILCLLFIFLNNFDFYINSLLSNTFISNRIIFTDTFIELYFLIICIVTIPFYNMFKLNKNFKIFFVRLKYNTLLYGLVCIFLLYFLTLNNIFNLLNYNLFLILKNEILLNLKNFSYLNFENLHISLIDIRTLMINYSKLNKEVTGTYVITSFNHNILFTNFLTFFNDNLSVWLVWLSFTILFIVSLGNTRKSRIHNVFGYSIYDSLLTLIIFCLIICFLSQDFFIFFLAFELVMFPLFVHMVLQGSRLNKFFAINFLVLYTLVGSVFLWYVVVFFIEEFGTTDYISIRWLIFNCLDKNSKIVLFLLLFLGFILKVPAVPVHQWLILAHVEAPTNGSIILAALLLKIGSYGMYRFVFSLFPAEIFDFQYPIMCLFLFSYLYSTLLAVRQIDIKRFIAYTSISHMNFSLLGLFSGFEVGILGFAHTTISHGIIATSLFFLIGFLYSLVGYRDTWRISGISNILPYFSFFWFIFSLANLGLPLLSAFPGELLIFFSIADFNPILLLTVFFGFFITGVYTFIQINKLLFGFSKLDIFLKNSDLTVESLSVLFYLLFFSIIFGICPSVITNSILI